MRPKTPALATARIQYTLPGYQPEITPVENDTDIESRPFWNRDLAPRLPDLVTWRHVLSVDHTAPDPSMCAPPQRSPSPHTRDTAAERNQWRRILTARSNPGAIASMPPAVGQMLALLEEYQQCEIRLLAEGGL